MNILFITLIFIVFLACYTKMIVYMVRTGKIKASGAKKRRKKIFPRLFDKESDKYLFKK